ncbi:unnamed protein product [Phaedon cochleariae]|uniref:Uncharacterized protein n=1 Tax=Phaedon cochleariae TaxID=80249 RepID=A0A9N9X444_PHACE|nr:unnamed protein product [Phaedon cochleariae]
MANGKKIPPSTQAALPDISSDNMAERKEKFLNKLAERVSSSQKIENIEISTRGQRDNNLWRELRMDYLTASNFGASPDGLVGDDGKCLPSIEGKLAESKKSTNCSTLADNNCIRLRYNLFAKSATKKSRSGFSATVGSSFEAALLQSQSSGKCSHLCIPSCICKKEVSGALVGQGPTGNGDESSRTQFPTPVVGIFFQP